MNELLSVIIPCYNEQEVIYTTWERVKKVLKDNQYKNHEIIFVNDGSSDNTINILKDIVSKDPSSKVISFSRNFGHESATSAGIKNCSGDLAFIIDADLQDPPELFPEMIKMYEEKQCNAVYGVRKSRDGESFLKKLTSKLFYRFYNYLSDVEFPVDTGDFRLIDKKIIDEFKQLNEKDKYVRGLLTWVGFKQEPLYYQRDARQGGETKYNYKKLVDLALKIIFSFTKKPLDLVLTVGLLCILLSFILIIYIFVSKFLAPLPGWASTLTIIVFFGGVQLLSIGVIAHYISIIFEEVKKRPEYIVDEKINFTESDED